MKAKVSDDSARGIDICFDNGEIASENMSETDALTLAYEIIQAVLTAPKIHAQDIFNNQRSGKQQ